MGCKPVTIILTRQEIVDAVSIYAAKKVAWVGAAKVETSHVGENFPEELRVKFEVPTPEEAKTARVIE